MTFASDDEIARIARGMIDRTLPKAEWTHAAHFAAALWLIRGQGAREASRLMPGYIRAYNVAVGGENTDAAGYHETITQASLRAAWSHLAASPDAPLWRVLETLLASEHGRSGWVLEHWSKERLFTPEARRSWVEPDLRALPF